MKKALIFQGGWDGHQPDLVSKRFGNILDKNNNVIYDEDEEYLANNAKIDSDIPELIAKWNEFYNNHKNDLW